MVKKIISLYIISAFLGLITGSIASLFQLTIVALDTQLTHLYHYASQHSWPVGLLSALISMLFVFIAWCSVHYLAPEASGSGVPEI